MLHGHERSITQIKYNREGDLLLSCAKDSQPNSGGTRTFLLPGHSQGTYKYLQGTLEAQSTERGVCSRRGVKLIKQILASGVVYFHQVDILFAV